MRSLILGVALALAACAAPSPPPESLGGVATIRELSTARLVVLTPFEQRVGPLYGRLVVAQRAVLKNAHALGLDQVAAFRAVDKTAAAKLQAAEIAEAKERSAPAAQRAGLAAEMEARITEATALVVQAERLAGVKR